MASRYMMRWPRSTHAQSDGRCGVDAAEVPARLVETHLAHVPYAYPALRQTA